MISFPCPDGFDLDRTLACGQCFRWQRQGDGWQGFAFGRELTVFQSGRTLVASCDEVTWETLWADYFDLRFDYAAVFRQLARRFAPLAAALQTAGGIHILRQDPWEALCSFLLSQNNNIARIRLLVQRLCAAFGAPVEGGFDFPTPQALANASQASLRALGVGYRAPYLLDAAEKVATGGLDLESLRACPKDEALAALQTVAGVGPKVAQCVLLYGLHRLDAFPMDVWMKRAMAQFFPDMAVEGFGPYAGVAQQALFHYIRALAGRA